MHGQHHHVWRAPAPACPRLISLASAISRNLLRVSQSLRGEGRTTWSSANTPPRPPHPFPPVRRALPDPPLSPPPRPQGHPFQEWQPPPQAPSQRTRSPPCCDPFHVLSLASPPHSPAPHNSLPLPQSRIQAISRPACPSMGPATSLTEPLPCSSLPSTGLGTSWGPVTCLARGHTDHPAPAPLPLRRVAERPEWRFLGVQVTPIPFLACPHCQPKKELVLTTGPG